MPIGTCRVKLASALNVLAIMAAISSFRLVFEPTEALAAGPATFTVQFPLASSVGPLRAGSLCLPKGAVRGFDLIPDEAQFGLLVEQMLDERRMVGSPLKGDHAAPSFELHLKSAAVKLCAKSWGMFGMGDTKSLSGESEFVFAWRAAGKTEFVSEIVTLKTQTKDRLTAPAIFRQAIAVVLDRVSKKML